MRLTSFLSPSQKVAVKKIVYPLCMLVTGNKRINTQYKFIEFSKKGCHTYFGYYDVTPFRDELIIYLEREKNSKESKIVLNDIHNSSKQYVADTRAWNWQQGSRLRWFPKSENVISFNDYIDGKYINRIINIKTKDEKRVDWPLYDIDSNGKIGITLNFERLGAKRPGYGYTCETYKEGNLWEDGISIIDIENNQLIKTITYRELSECITKVDNVSHFYINHLAFSPDGHKFMFFWIDEKDGYHQASMGVYDIKEGVLIPLEIEKKVSHYVWDGNNELICTVLDNIQFTRYYRYSLTDRSKKIICEECLQRDGHPSIYSKDILLTDTYPDTRGFQHIYLVDEKADNKSEILKIYSIPKVEAELFTDLHPRLSSNKKYVAFDSNHDGIRKMLVLDLGKQVL